MDIDDECCLVGIDYQDFAEKVVIGDKILIDYGGVVLTVTGFESEAKYLRISAKRKSEGIEK